MANEVDATAVVVSSHRKSMLAEFMMGSISNFLVHQCDKPVIVLHAPRFSVRSPLHMPGKVDVEQRHAHVRPCNAWLWHYQHQMSMKAFQSLGRGVCGSCMS